MSSEGTDDIAAAAPPSIVKAAGGLALGAGATAILVVIQAFSGFFVPTSALLWLAPIGVLGLLAAVSGLGLLRARAWAGAAGISATTLLAMVSGGWLVRAALGGFFSLFALVTPWLALAAAASAIGSLGALKKVTLARERLRAQGLDLGQ
jgi:hypothetical protein